MSVLQVENLSRSYNGRRGVSGVSFCVNPGEIVGFIGPNGSGKTTTLRCIMDIIRRDTGDILINGHSMPKERIKALSHTACWMDIGHLFYDLSAADHIDFIQKTRNVSKEVVKKYTKLFDIDSYLKLKVHKYSYGMKQRLGLSLAAMTESSLYLLDEPTNGLDPIGVTAFREVLLMLAKEKNCAIFFSSHALTELSKVADRALFIKNGEIVHTEINKGGHVYHIKVESADHALTLIPQIHARAEDGYIIFDGTVAINAVLSALYHHNVTVLDVEKKEADLENIFHKLYEDQNV